MSPMGNKKCEPVPFDFEGCAMRFGEGAVRKRTVMNTFSFLSHMPIPLNQVPVTLIVLPQCTAFNPPIPAALWQPGSESLLAIASLQERARACSSANLSRNPSWSWAPLNIVNLSQGDKHTFSFSAA